MRVIEPIQVTDDILVDSSIPEPDTARGEPDVFGPEQTYAKGDRCIDLYNHTIYASAIDDNTGNVPHVSPITQWVRFGPTNRWAVFDGQGNISVAEGEAWWEFAPGIVSAAGAAGMDGVSHLRVLQTLDDETLVDHDHPLEDTPIFDFEDFLSLADQYRLTKVDWELRPEYGATLRVTLTGPSTIKVAGLVIGYGFDYGRVEWEFGGSTNDYARQVTDDNGNPKRLPGPVARNINGVLEYDTSKLEPFRRLKQRLLGVTTIWEGVSGIDQFADPATIYGTLQKSDWKVIQRKDVRDTTTFLSLANT